jgi:glycogen debranching enzyme
MSDQELREAARRLLLSNLRSGYSALLRRSHCYVAPSPRTYPYQWFWDTCFHVVMLARLGEHEIAKRNLRSLFAMQEDDGFVGHMVFWKQALPRRYTDVIQARPRWRALRPHMSALIQPPLAATALHCLYEECKDRVYLGELYARVRRQHDWLAQNRDFDGDGLLSIISPFESGMDWKPSYDPVLGYEERITRKGLLTSPLFWKAVGVDWSNFIRRYDLKRIRRRARFIVKDAGFNAFYALDLHCMEKLAAVAGDDPRIFAARRRRLVQSMVEKMYEHESAAFYDIREPGSEKLRILTPTIFFPLAIEELDQDIAKRVVERHFAKEGEFRVPLPIPSLATGDPSFYPGQTPFIWRGPTWALDNWFLFHAFSKRGFGEEAQALRKSLRSLVEKSGFREYYSPQTGNGYGARHFTWSALLLDMN